MLADIRRHLIIVPVTVLRFSSKPNVNVKEWNKAVEKMLGQHWRNESGVYDTGYLPAIVKL